MKLSKVRYKFGGAMRMKNVAGTDIKRQNQMSDFVAPHAKKAEAHMVEGPAPKARLDRPMRKIVTSPEHKMVDRGDNPGFDGGGAVTDERAAAERRGREAAEQSLEHNRAGAAERAPLSFGLPLMSVGLARAAAAQKTAHEQYQRDLIAKDQNKPDSARDGFANGGSLTTKARNQIADKNFAVPTERKYPVDTPNRARNALARVSQFGSSEEKSKVRAKVHQKYPGIGKKDR